MTNPAPDPAALDAWLHLSSPRVRFLKSLPAGSTVLDLGAGEGSLGLFKSWLSPQREDLRMFAVSLVDGPHKNLYEAWENGDFETADPFPGRVFDAIYAAHFAEHITGGVERVLAWIATRIAPQGRVYVEMPSAFSRTGPRCAALRAAGHNVSTTNFHDDNTHKETVDLDTLRSAMRGHGLFVEESGYWRNPYLESTLFELARRTDDRFHATVAVWMATRFAQYAMAVKDDVDTPRWGLTELHAFVSDSHEGDFRR